MTPYIPARHLELPADFLRPLDEALIAYTENRFLQVEGRYLQTLVVSITPAGVIMVEGWSESSNVRPLPPDHPDRVKGKTCPSFIGTAFIPCQTRTHPPLAFVRQLPEIPVPVFQINSEPPFLLLREADPHDKFYDPRPLHGLRHLPRDCGIDGLPATAAAMKMLTYRRACRARDSYTDGAERRVFEKTFTLI